MTAGHEDCAKDVLDVAMLVMQVFRTEMRSHRTPDLSIPQFRALAFLNRQPGATLSEAAEHIGLTPPSMSKMVDGLVARELVAREVSANDRRRLILTLTDAGRSLLNGARAGTLTALAKRLEALSEDDLRAVDRAMDILHPVFTPENQAGVNVHE